MTVPRELAYGNFSRFSDCIGKRPPRTISRMLFGIELTKFTIDYPTGLEHLEKVLPLGHSMTAQQIIEDGHSFFNIHRAFLPKKRMDEIRDGMLASRKQGVDIQSGQVSAGIKAKAFLCFCTACAIGDREKFGFAVWHTEHQLPGVYLCPHDGTPLCETQIPASELGNFYSLEKLLKKNGYEQISIKEGSATLIQIARNMDWLLMNKTLEYNPTELRQRYLAALQRHDLATARGSVKIKELVEEFSRFYDPEFLSLIGCALVGKPKRNWLAKIAQKNQLQHPLRHVLVMTFLGISAEKFFLQTFEQKPFGEAPWPCLNKICPHYHEEVIETINLGYSRISHGEPLGTFKCPVCKYVYSRVGPDTCLEDRFKGKKLEYGELWEQKLKEIWHTDLMQKEKAEILRVTTETLKSHARKLKLVEDVDGASNKPIITLSDLEECKVEWKRVIQQNPKIPISQLIEDYSDIYWTIHRFEADFLQANKQTKTLPVSSNPMAVDWKARDKKYAPQIKHLVEELLAETKPMKRVTINAIGIMLGFRDGSFQRDLKRLSKTHEKLLPHLESPEQFALRRIKYVESLYRSEKIIPSQWQFIKRAGLSESVQTKIVLESVEKAINYLNK
jgi:hypothetical protein